MAYFITTNTTLFDILQIIDTMPKKVQASLLKNLKSRKDILQTEQELEDFLDVVEADKHKAEPTFSLRSTVKELDKKHGIKR